MNTTDNNKLIAEFLGYEPNSNGVYPIVCINEGKGWHLETMKYHTDWNWLMEVVEKIESLDIYYDEYIDYNSSMVSSGKIELSTKIEAVYNACVEFIKYYNDESKTS